jgi:DNA-binding IclR family transcriptional regulator
MHYRCDMSNIASRPDSPVQSVDRAMAILEILAASGDVGVTEIARNLEVHKSTAFRLLAALEARGLVEQHQDRGKYRLGRGILRLAAATTARLDIIQESRPLARQLAQETGETVNIAVLSDGAALYLDQVAGSSALQARNWVGQRIPLHATSNGKVLLGGLSDEDALREAEPMRRYTAHTITSRAGLLGELAEARSRGWAIAIDELEVGLTAVASPILNAQGDVIGSMSVSGPTFRLGARRIPELAASVSARASDVSVRMGWHPRVSAREPAAVLDG